MDDPAPSASIPDEPHRQETRVETWGFKPKSTQMQIQTKDDTADQPSDMRTKVKREDDTTVAEDGLMECSEAGQMSNPSQNRDRWSAKS